MQSMDYTSLAQHVDDIRAQIEARLGIRGRDLDHQLHKAGRLLPKSIQREAHYLAQARMLSQNPKLARMIDLNKAEKAVATVTAHLATIKAGERIKNRMLGIAGVLAFNFLLIAAALIAYLRWRGIV